MRNTIKNAVSESVQDLISAGFSTSFSKRDLRKFGIKIPDVRVGSEKIKTIRHKTHSSQTVFARLLNVSPSSIRQWEQGKRKPTGSTKVLLDILDREPHILDYRMGTVGVRNRKAA